MKLYSDDPSSKYSGGPYETIDSKLPVFYDLCVCDEVHLARLGELRRTSFGSIARENPDKSKLEVLELLIKKVDQLVKATTRNVALLSLPATFTGLCAQLRSGVANALLCRETRAQYLAAEPTPDDDQYWVDRKYNGQRNRQADSWRQRGSSRGNHVKNPRRGDLEKNTYFANASRATFSHFLIDYEGDDPNHLEEASGDEDPYPPDDEDHEDTAFFTSTAFFGKSLIDGPSTFSKLCDQATLYAITGVNQRNEEEHVESTKNSDIFTLNSRYSITTDAGLNFHAAEFKRAARGLSIDVKEAPIKAHHSIGKVERYHAALRRAYDIIRAESNTEPEVALQLAVKSINDTAGPDSLVPTLLVFGAYPCITEDSPPAATTAQQAEAVKKAMTAVRQLHAKRQVREALATREIRDTIVVGEEPSPPRRRRGRPRKYPPTTFIAEIHPTFNGAFLTAKEQADYTLAIKLRKKGVITALGKPFKESDQAEVKGLIDRGVFYITTYDKNAHGGIQIFKSRLEVILTQSPTIQQICHLYPSNAIMVVLKPLYGIAEAGTHWWATYSSYYRENLEMDTSTFDPCLLISSPNNENFGLIGMQTDDTIGLTDEKFSA
ncbi:hypothetical protein LZ31DRAFT_601700 [Colletotrichum somersetense]|nr:hypothetical protein LZ31DRAFT_601700 [Colletotrichum somersetense]